MEPMLSTGQVIDAVVTQVEQYGAWIDHNGLRGLVNIPEVSWTRIGHPADVLSLGQTVRAKILGVNADQFWASIRAAHPELDPWRDPLAFVVGSEFSGPVVRELEYGCFVELRPDVWGLLRREKLRGEVSVGDRLRVRIEHADPTTRKIELSQLSPLN